MKTGKLIVTLACLVAVGASLGACREDEQGRVLLFNKGVYLGKADTPITDEARRAMRLRTARQAASRGIAGGAGGGGSSLGRPPDVRPPSAKSDDAMRQRARRQSGN